MNQQAYTMSQLVDLAREGNPDDMWLSVLADKEKEAPYASLVHILRGMKEDTAENRFKAAIFSPERGMLKALILPDPVSGLTPPSVQPVVEEEQPLKDPVKVLPVPDQPLEAVEKPQEPEVMEEAVSQIVPEKESPLMNHVTVVDSPVVSSESSSSSAPARKLTAWKAAPFSVNTVEPDSRETFSSSWMFSVHHTGSTAEYPVAFSDFIKEKTSQFAHLSVRIRRELSPLVQQKVLVQRFLATPPTNIRRPAIPASSSNSSQLGEHVAQSIESDQDLATETLARLHVKQNHPDEAIRIYEKLCLRYPEKKAYFTTQIKKIKEQNI